MVLAEQWQCSLYANVLSVQSSVPTMFLHLFANRRVTNGRVLPFPILAERFRAPTAAFRCTFRCVLLETGIGGGGHISEN